jgi:hypothetical protein
MDIKTEKDLTNRNSSDDDDDEHHSDNPSASDNASRDDESNNGKGGDVSITAPGTVENATDSKDSSAVAAKRKRTTIDESTLNADDLQKLESRRAYNRHCAAKGTFCWVSF